MTRKDLIRRWVDLFNAGDADGLAACYAPDAVNHQVCFEPVVGRDAIHAMFAREFGAAEMVCIIEAIYEDEDSEVAMLEWSDPNGLRGCGFFTIRDGLIQFQRGYWDRLTFMKAQGMETFGL